MNVSIIVKEWFCNIKDFSDLMNVVVHSTKFLLYIASEFSVPWVHLSQLGSVSDIHQI